MIPHTTTMETWNNQKRKKYQIDTIDQDAPLDIDEDTVESSYI